MSSPSSSTMRHRHTNANASDEFNLKGTHYDPHWVRKNLSSFVLRSRVRKQLMTCFIIGNLIWSFIATIIIVSPFVNPFSNGDSSVSSASLTAVPQFEMDSFKGPKWNNDKQTLETQTIYENAWLSLSQHSVMSQNGKLINDWLWVDTMHQINVLVSITIEKTNQLSPNKNRKNIEKKAKKTEEFIIFEQTKYGYNNLSYAVVGGHIEKGESPLNAAKRELAEELHRKTSDDKDWIYFGSFLTDVNRGAGWCHTYLARFTVRLDGQSGHLRSEESFTDEMEELNAKQVNLTTLLDHYQSGLFKEAKWSNTVGLGISYLLTNSGHS